MNISDEAIDAAAKAIYECQPLHGFPSGEVILWDDLTAGAFAKRGLMMEQARAALEAAAPHIVREAQAEAWSEGTHFGGLYRVVFPNDNPYRSNP